MDFGHMDVVLEWCLCMLVVDLGFGMIIIIIMIITVLSCFFSLFFFPFLSSFVSFPYSFLEFIKCVCGLR